MTATALKVREQLSPHLHYTSGKGNKRRFITVHETGNVNKGADAAAHAKLQARGNSRASWHYQVDDKEAVLSFTHEYRCWHAGDGAGKGNFESIAVEICVNADGDFEQALRNAAALINQIMVEENIPLANVVQHNKWSGKNCPTNLRKKKNWKRFLEMVKRPDMTSELAQPKPVEPAKPAKAKPSRQIKVDNLFGKETIGLFQEVLGTPVDKVISSQSRAWKRKNPGLTSGWEWVAPSKAGGSLAIFRHQEILKERGFYKGALDGLIGPMYISAVQADLGVAIDGEIWKPSPAVGALQRRLNKGTV